MNDYNLPTSPDAPNKTQYMRATVDKAQKLIDMSRAGDPAFYSANRLNIHRALSILGNANAINKADYVRDKYTGAYDDDKHVAARQQATAARKAMLATFAADNPNMKASGNNGVVISNGSVIE